jgi:uncharacterized protein (TIRG00374 family)
MSRVGILVDTPRVFLVTAATWLSMSVGMSSLRWWTLLRGVGYRIPYRRAVALQTMALFFNGVVPGNIGGDFLKNHAVMGRGSGRLVVLILVERLIGLIALVWVACIGVLPSLDRFGEASPIRSLLYVLVALMAGSILGPWVLVRLRLDERVRQRLALPAGQGLVGRGARAILRFMDSVLVSFDLIKGAKSEVARAFVFSFVMHTGNMLYFLFLTRQLGNPHATVVAAAMVFPVGMLSLVLPISVSGLGVGHVMFNELFRLIGLKGGANVFNVFIVAQIAPCVLGALPYLILKRDFSAPQQSEPPTP